MKINDIIINEVSLNGYLPAAERSKAGAEYAAKVLKDKDAQRTIANREKGMSRHLARYMKANPRPTPTPRPAQKSNDPYIDYSDDYTTWKQGK